jgi:hypothetical protein
MNYGIAPGGGFGMSVPLNGYSSYQGINYNQGQWGSMPQQTWTSQTMQGWGYASQPNGYWNTNQTQGWGYSQPLNTGWNNIQPTGYGQTLSNPLPYYNTPQIQNYGFPSIPMMGGCGNCGHTKPVIRRDW